MNLRVSVKSAHIFGGNLTYGSAGLYLRFGLGHYGAAVRDVEITACFRGGKQNPNLRQFFEQFHATFLPGLPSAKFLRGKGRIDLAYETRVADAAFLEEYRRPTPDVFARVLAELAAQLRLINRRLKATDDFDAARFHDDVTRLVNVAPKTEEALLELQASLDRQASDALAAMDPWDRLGIDWDEYHPDARRLLGDLFFWDGDDYNAPHGNDTGADLLSEFKGWSTSHPDRPAYVMARALLRGWGFAPIDPDAAEGAEAGALSQSEQIALSVHDEAMIAVAFASVKCRGCCDPDTRDLALKAIARQRRSAEIGRRGWDGGGERIRKLDVLAATLRRVPSW